MKRKIDKVAVVGVILFGVFGLLLLYSAIFNSDYYTNYYANVVSVSGISQSIANLIATVGYFPVALFCSAFCFITSIVGVFGGNIYKDEEENIGKNIL